MSEPINLAKDAEDIYSLDGTPGSGEAAIRREMDEANSDLQHVIDSNLTAIHGGPPPVTAPMGFPNFENAPSGSVTLPDGYDQLP